MKLRRSRTTSRRPGLLSHLLPILLLHMGVAQLYKLSPLLRDHPLPLLYRCCREVSSLLTESIGGLSLLIQHLAHEVHIR